MQTLKNGVKAFLTGTHPRLGEKSPVSMLPKELVMKIIEEHYLFPIDILEVTGRIHTVIDME